MEVFAGSIALYNNFKSIVLICINKISTTSLVFNNDKLSAYKLFSEESLQETPSLNQLSTPKIFGVRTLKCTLACAQNKLYSLVTLSLCGLIEVYSSSLLS